MSVVKQLADILGKARKAYPHMRIGQIISNAVDIADGIGGDGDIFYYEDDDLIRAIARYVERAQP